MNRFLYLIKTYCLPRWLFQCLQPAYHWILGFLGHAFYGFPSNKMIVIGITGTTGKTTTVYFLAHLLRQAGFTVGYTSTALYSDGKQDFYNTHKMTMMGRFFIPQMLSKMVKNKCDVAIVETTSEGIVQYRHRFINYDVVLFTGLYPEHIESHGSFENYKAAKGQLFQHLSSCSHKTWSQINTCKIQQTKESNCKKDETIAKTIIVNGDDEHAEYFFSFDADQHIAWGEKDAEKTVLAKYFSSHKKTFQQQEFFRVTNTSYKNGKHTFTIRETTFEATLLGDFTRTNLTAAIMTAHVLRIPLYKLAEGAKTLTGAPGRLERIDEGQDFTVVVDYAFEPKAITKLYETIADLNPQRIIHVLGSTGGGRDTSRRIILGRLAGKNANVVIVTNEDPYDDDPQKIINDVVQGVREVGHVDYLSILDRTEAITKAIALAQKEDIVLITGKGCEQAMCVAGCKKIPWDDRTVARKAIKEKNRM